MAGEVDEIKQLVRAMAPAADWAQAILALRSQANAIAVKAEACQALVKREGELTKAIAAAEAVYAAKLDELQAEHEGRKSDLGQQIAKAIVETDQVIARTKKEATDYIAQTDAQRGQVEQALKAAQVELAEFRRQAKADVTFLNSERDQAADQHERLKAERVAELAALNQAIADKKRLDAEISERLAAFARR